MQQFPTAEPRGMVSPTQRVGKSVRSKSRIFLLLVGCLLRAATVSKVYALGSKQFLAKACIFWACQERPGKMTKGSMGPVLGYGSS